MTDPNDPFITKDGRTVRFEWSDDAMKVHTIDDDSELIGTFSFAHIEGPTGRGHDDHWHLTHMHLEGPPSDPGSYLRQGIGREILRRVRDSDPITFSVNDGAKRDDGSHLTEDGPGFAQRMVAEGLASWDGREETDDDMGYDD